MSVDIRPIYRVIFVLLIVQLVAIGFCIWGSGDWLVGEVKAAKVYEDFEHAKKAVIDTNNACDASGSEVCPATNAGEGAYRLQVQIPGVGERCYYPGPAGEVGKWEIKTCNYMPGDMDLRHWIVAIYKFGVGLALALAVLMIMVGGFQRILAAGVSQKISNANTTILAAISGAVLALGSYALLYTLDVRLTQFEELVPASITGIEQAEDLWCANFPKFYQGDSKKPMIFYKEGHWGEVGAGIGGGEGYKYLCGQSYQFGYEDGGYGIGDKVKLGKGQTCFGDYCGGGDKLCIAEMGVNYCVDPKERCTKIHKNNCDGFNQIISTSITRDMSCMMRDDYNMLFGNPNECVWNERIFCPQGTERVSCLAGPEYNKANNTGCWVLYKGKTVPLHVTDQSGFVWGATWGIAGSQFYCTDSKYANSEANLVCCVKSVGTESEFKAYSRHNGAYDPDCTKVTKCEVAESGDDKYRSQDALDSDPCNVCH